MYELEMFDLVPKIIIHERCSKNKAITYCNDRVSK